MKHIHKLELINLSRSKDKPYPVYICRLEGCTSFYRLEMTIGKRTLCWSCGKSTEILRRHIHRKTKKIVCEECKQKLYPTSKKPVSKEVGDEFDFDDFVSGLGVQ